MSEDLTSEPPTPEPEAPAAPQEVAAPPSESLGLPAAPISRDAPPSWLLWLQLILFLALVAVRFCEPVGDADLFWQMAYGKYMLENHTLIPDHTIYSWTPAQTPVLYCSWIAEISLHLLYQMGGLGILFALRYGIVLSTVGFAYLFARRLGFHHRSEFWLMATWLVLSSYVGSILKPEMYSLFFLSAYAYCLYRFRLEAREGGKAMPYLVAMPILMWLWVNSHGVFFFGLMGLGLFTFGEMCNWIVSPGLALPRAWRKTFVGAVVVNLLATLLTPYHYHLLEQLLGELYGVVSSEQEAGRKAAYNSLAAHQPIWKATAFHFHEYLAIGALFGGLVCTWLVFHGRHHGKKSYLDRIDVSYFCVNLILAYGFTVYLRSTYYWPPFFFYSTLSLLHELRRNPDQDPSGDIPDSWLDFGFVALNMLFIWQYFGKSDVLASRLLMEPGSASKLVILGGLTAQILVAMSYTIFRVGLWPDRRLTYLRPRGWLTIFAILGQIYLSQRSIRESIYFPYASSWCGFGISYWNPVVETEFIEKFHPDIKTIINDYDSGGYLLWKLYPKTKVMIDPRSFPFISFWKDYIEYERGQQGLEFLNRFPGKKPDVSLVSLKNQNLWRTYMRSKEWSPGWLGTAYVIFVRKGFTYPEEAAKFMPGRFETVENAQKALQIYQFGIETQLFDYSWIILDVMKRKFYRTAEERMLVDNLDAYKQFVVALQGNDIETAVKAQEACLQYGQFVNAGALLNLYKYQLSQLEKAGKKNSKEYQEILGKAQSLVQAANSGSMARPAP